MLCFLQLHANPNVLDMNTALRVMLHWIKQTLWFSIGVTRFCGTNLIVLCLLSPLELLDSLQYTYTSAEFRHQFYNCLFIKCQQSTALSFHCEIHSHFLTSSTCIFTPEEARLRIICVFSWDHWLVASWCRPQFKVRASSSTSMRYTRPTCEVMHEPRWTDHLLLHCHLGETPGLFRSSSNRSNYKMYLRLVKLTLSYLSLDPSAITLNTDTFYKLKLTITPHECEPRVSCFTGEPGINQ